MKIQTNDIIEKLDHSPSVERSKEKLKMLIRQATDGSDIVRFYVREFSDSKKKDIYILTNTVFTNVWESASDKDHKSKSFLLDSFRGSARAISAEHSCLLVDLFFDGRTIEVRTDLDDKDGMAFTDQLEKVIFDLQKKNRAS